MKKLNILVIALFVTAFLLGGCAKDNFDPPQTWMTGRLVYNGEPFYLDGNPDKGDDDLLHFFQDGWGKHEGWAIRVRENGTFSSLLFDGEYKLIVRPTLDFPFEWTGWPKNSEGGLDTMVINLKGDKVIPDIEVTPYYQIKDLTIAGGPFVTATFNLQEVLPEANVHVEKVYMYMNVGQLVHSGSQVSQSIEVTDITKPITIKMPVAKYRDGYVNNFREYGFVRIAVKLSNTTRMLWSPVQRVDNLPIALNDVSSQYLKNYQAPYKAEEGCPQKDSYSTPADWNVNDAVRLYGPDKESGKMYGGLELRMGRSCIGAINYDLAKPAIVNGKMYQTFTLPAGHYIFSGTHFSVFFPSLCAPGCGHIVVAKGDIIPDKNQLSTSIGYNDTYEDASVEFRLTEQTKIAVGFLFNFPSGNEYAYGFTKTSLIQLE